MPSSQNTLKWTSLIVAPIVLLGGIYVTFIMEKNAHLAAKITHLEQQLDKTTAERDEMRDQLKNVTFVRIAR